MISLTEDKSLLGYELLNSYSNISHFVTTRHGGCSEGTYGTFNCSHFTADKANNVRKNQSLLLNGLKQHLVKELVIPEQVHEDEIRKIDKEFFDCSVTKQRNLLHGVDAMTTNEPGYCLCISTADCVPILLYDTRHKAIAAIHAGWRGTEMRLVESTIAQMNTWYGTRGEDIVACIGPSISLESFEVGEEVYDRFDKAGFDMSRISFLKEETGKHHIDLWEANRMSLLKCCVPADQIEVANICTYIHHKDFFSARRLGINSGRILSGIMLNDKELDKELERW